MTFLRYFPDVKTLAEADESLLLKVWQGLGYYSRALNMQTAARQIMDGGGRFPSTWEGIRALKGVGDYTASAIASIAFSLPYAAVDGNVKRVASRLYGLREPLQSSKAARIITEMLNEHIQDYDPGEFNQAMMELGATICTPRKPDCPVCPLKARCFAFREGEQHTLPVVQPKKKARVIHLNYLFADFQGQTFVLKRGREGIWKGLYEFYSIEGETAEDQPPSAFSEYFDQNAPIELISVKRYVHKLTHITIFAAFWHMSGLPSNIVKESRVLIPVETAEVSSYPVHRLMHRYLQDQGLEQKE